MIDSVLDQNINDNIHLVTGSIRVRELDWTAEPERWSWTDTKSVSSPSLPERPPTEGTVGPPFDLIVTSDTVYVPRLVQPLLRTIHRLASLSFTGGKSPLILVCFERRDPLLIDRTLDDARRSWGLKSERVPHKNWPKRWKKQVSDGTEKTGAVWNCGNSNWPSLGEGWPARLGHKRNTLSYGLYRLCIRNKS